MRPNALASEQYHPTSSEPEPTPNRGFPLDVSTHWQPRSDHRYRGIHLRIKRFLDVIGAVGLAAVFLPVMAATAVAIRLSSPGPVIFRQTRVGRGGRLFTMYKFRTMYPDAERRLRADQRLHGQYLAGGFKLPCELDPRIIGIGTFLRKRSIDELPQLLNIIRGEMSLVGPRPVLPEELAQYGEYVGAYLMAVPGLTGAWQVAGRDAVKFPGRARLDAAYIDGWSLQRDFSILTRTVSAAASARGVE
ncbi:MAG: sugar transferase [Acidimicrobiales bacterium]